MYLLDTNVVSELRKATRAERSVVTFVSHLPSDQVWLSAMTLMELEIGVLRMERCDPVQGARLRLWLATSVADRFDGRILPVDSTIARMCARLHVPDPRPERDAVIAATALVHGLTVVTRNTADFAPMGVSVLDPWSVPSG